MKKIRITTKELWNLNGVLADIIHQYLVAFKAYDRHLILYSPDYENPDWDFNDEVRDETEWFLNELIWTFKTLADGCDTPEIEELRMEIFGGEFLDEDGNFRNDYGEHPRYEEFRKLENDVDARVKSGLDLFAKYFQSLWD